MILGSSLSLAADDSPLEGSNLITAIEVEGNEKLAEEDILAPIETEVGDRVSSQRLQEDLQSIFDLGYFFNLEIHFEPYQDGVKLIFEVVENPTLDEIKFKGNEALDDDLLAEKLSLEAGQILNNNHLDQGLRNVESYYQEQGYILMRIDDIYMEEDGVLEIEINEGRLNEIKIQGNEKTKDFVIERNLSQESGDVFNAQQLQSDLRDIFNLGFFEDIIPHLEEADRLENEVDLVLEVEEGKTGTFGIGAGYNSGIGWLGHFEIQEDNLRGRAQRIKFRWEFGEQNTYELSFHEPWVFGTDTSFGFSIYDKTREGSGDFGVEEDDDEQNIEYEEHRRGGSITLGRPLTNTIDGSLRYQYESFEYESLESDYRILDEESESTVRSLTFSGTRDTRDNIFEPRSGTNNRVSVKYAGQLLGGDNDFTKYQVDLRKYTADFLSDSNSWAFRSRFGLSDGDLPQGERYRIGGAEGVRGYERTERDLTGDSMMALSAEYRIPVADNFTGVLFADAGNAWDSSFSSSDLKKSAGLGVRVHTPIGQLRLDYGWGEDESRPHFSLGQAF